jgi:hypothetical protein
MADIVDLLVGLLCMQNTQSRCQQFLAGYNDVVQLVWLVFFPTVFLLIFIYLLAEGIVKGVEGNSKKKLQTLLSVAIYLFIIFQGWYHIFLSLSRFWFIAVIVLSGFFVFINKMGGAGRSGSGGKGLASGLKKELGGKLFRKYVSGQKKDMLHHIDVELDNLENIKKDIEEARSDTSKDVSRLREVFTLTLERIEHHLEELRKEESLGGVVVLGTEYKKRERRLHDLTKEIRNKLEKSGM